MMTSFDFRIFDRILELFEEFEFQWLWPSCGVCQTNKKKAPFIGDLYAYVCVCIYFAEHRLIRLARWTYKSLFLLGERLIRIAAHQPDPANAQKI